MLDYIYGKLVKKDSQSITLDLRGIGFKINCSNTSFYKENEDYKIYVYLYKRDDVLALYGFNSIKQKELFLKLIEINGIGPKIASSIISLGTVDETINAINSDDVTYLKRASNVNNKVAQTIILELKNKLISEDKAIYKTSEIEDARSALLSLSFKAKEIDPLINEAKDTYKTSKELVSYVLKCIGNSRGI